MKRKKIEYKMSDLANRNAEVSHIVIKAPQDFKDMFAEAVAEEGKTISYTLRLLMMKYLDERGKITYKPEM